MNFRKFFLFFSCLVIGFLGCYDGEDAETSAKRLDADQQKSLSCSSPSGWNTADIDTGNTEVASGTIGWYQCEVGWTRYQYPVGHYKYARLEIGWPICLWDKDNFYYFTDSYFTDPANISNIRVRVLSDCMYSTSKLPAVSYIDATTSYPFGITGRYLRVTLGEFQPTDILLVAP